MFILAQLYLLISKLFLAGKDSTSYLLKANFNTDPLTLKRIKRWHRDGVALDILFTLGAIAINPNYWWQICISSLLIRLSVFDLAFNKWSGLNIHHLGTTAMVDKFFVKIFGKNGALTKSIFFFILLIIFDILIVVC